MLCPAGESPFNAHGPSPYTEEQIWYAFEIALVFADDSAHAKIRKELNV